eukprot:scaffold76476_cov22-Tisochrysis_lutea.AAC.4
MGIDDLAPACKRLPLPFIRKHCKLPLTRQMVVHHCIEYFVTLPDRPCLPMQTEDLARMYRLFHRIPKGLEPVAEIFKQHVDSEGSKLVKEVSEDVESKKQEGEGVEARRVRGGRGVWRARRWGGGRQSGLPQRTKTLPIYGDEKGCAKGKQRDTAGAHCCQSFVQTKKIGGCANVRKVLPTSKSADGNQKAKGYAHWEHCIEQVHESPASA